MCVLPAIRPAGPSSQQECAEDRSPLSQVELAPGTDLAGCA